LFVCYVPVFFFASTGCFGDFLFTFFFYSGHSRYVAHSLLSVGGWSFCVVLTLFAFYVHVHSHYVSFALCLRWFRFAFRSSICVVFFFFTFLHSSFLPFFCGDCFALGAWFYHHCCSFLPPFTFSTVPHYSLFPGSTSFCVPLLVDSFSFFFFFDFFFFFLFVCVRYRFCVVFLRSFCCLFYLPTLHATFGAYHLHVLLPVPVLVVWIRWAFDFIPSFILRSFFFTFYSCIPPFFFFAFCSSPPRSIIFARLVIPMIYILFTSLSIFFSLRFAFFLFAFFTFVLRCSWVRCLRYYRFGAFCFFIHSTRFVFFRSFVDLVLFWCSIVRSFNSFDSFVVIQFRCTFAIRFVLSFCST